jgi:hypothetical protein
MDRDSAVERRRVADDRACLLAAALAVGIHEAWTKRRGVLGWIVNIVVSLLGAFLVTDVGELAMVIILRPFVGGASSFAAAGGAVMSVALAGGMLITLMGAWGALWIVNRWR